MAITSVRRLYVLLVGYEVLPKSVSTKGRGERFMMSEPICCYLLDTETGWVLMDAGFDPVYVRDPDLCREYFHSVGSYPPIVTPENELPLQMARLGISFQDVTKVVLSHFALGSCRLPQVLPARSGLYPAPGVRARFSRARSRSHISLRIMIRRASIGS